MPPKVRGAYYFLSMPNAISYQEFIVRSREAHESFLEV